MQIKVSILIPVYNTGEYLRACLDSVLMQVLNDWELILIDDGSRDNSGVICDEYAEKDERIRVIHKDNEGVSIARNVGLAEANGEYIGFIDSDDCVEPDMFFSLYQEAKKNNADISMCDTVTVYSDGRTESDTIAQLGGSAIIHREDWNPRLLLEMAGSACRCIYRRSLLFGNGVKFPTGLRFSEDRIFNLYAMGYANAVAYIKEPYYRRLLRPESAIHKFYPDYFNIVKDAAERTRIAIVAAWQDDPTIQRAYLGQFVSGAIAAISNYFYRTSTLPLRIRLRKVRELCSCNELCAAIEGTGYGGIRGKLILKKAVWTLVVSAKLANMKNGR